MTFLLALLISFEVQVAPAYAEVDCVHTVYTGYRYRFWNDPIPSPASAAIAGMTAIGSDRQRNRSLYYNPIGDTNTLLRTGCLYA